MAPVTPGQARVQAMATALTVVPCRRAMGRSASRNARLRLSRGGLKSGDRRRQSSSRERSIRSWEKLSVSRPDCSGLYPMTPVPWAGTPGNLGFRGLPPDQRERRLQRIDVPDSLTALQQGHPEIGDADGPDLPLLHQPGHRFPGLLDRSAGLVGPVKLV